MRYLVLLLLLASFLGSTLARAEEIPQDESLVEQTIADETLNNQNDMIQIVLSSGITYEFKAQPSDPSLLKPFLSLAPEKQEIFRQRRLSFLTQVAKVVSATKFAFGAGSLVGRSFIFIKKTFKKSADPAPAPEKISFRERSHRAAQKVLESIDAQLWSQAPLIVDSNEYGVSASVAFVALAGYREHGLGGVHDVGMSFVYSQASRGLVFEFYYSIEKFQSGEPVAGAIAISPKLGFIATSREQGPTGYKLDGTVHGPPLLPGYIAAGENIFGTGAMLTLGLPPTPIADIMGYTTAFERRTMIRITISPFVKGFVRLEVGDIKGNFKAIYSDFKSVLASLRYRIQVLRYGSCGKVFAS